MPEHERRKAQLARLLATVSVLGISVGMFRPAAAEDLTPSQQDKWMPTAQSGATQQEKWTPNINMPNAATGQSNSDTATGQASGKRLHKPVTITNEWGASSPQLDAASKDALQNGAGGATITHSGGATEQMNLDTFTGGVHPDDQLGSGSGTGKISTTPGSADYMKYDTKQGKFKGEDVAIPAVQNKMNQPDAFYVKQTMPNVTVPAAGPAQPK